jgi:enolase
LRIEDVSARVMYNGRGDPAIEAEVSVSGRVGRAISPSGASRGKHEAVSFAPGGPDRTVQLVAKYHAKLIGVDPSDPAVIASVLKKIDGTANYARIGGATAYSISVAAAHAAALSKGVPLCRLIDAGCSTLPIPLGNIIGGGKHAGDRSPSLQEILVAPVGARSPREAMEMNLEVHSAIGERLAKTEGYPVGRGDEGAWAPGLTDEAALECARSVAAEVSDRRSRDIKLGVDVAAGSLYDKKKARYNYRASGKSLNREAQISYLSELTDRFGLFYLEDPLQEEDFEGFASLTASLKRSLVVGDDLYTTSTHRLRSGIARKSTGGVIMKVNQVGTLGEAMEFSKLARDSGQMLIASHRSGDNESPHLAHFAIGMGCELIKTGIVGGERTAKLNELLRIAELLGTTLASLGSTKQVRSRKKLT